MQVKKQQLELDMGQQTGLKLGKEYIKAVYCHLAYLIYAEYIKQKTGLEEAQTVIKLPGDISITSDIQMEPSLLQKGKRN